MVNIKLGHRYDDIKPRGQPQAVGRQPDSENLFAVNRVYMQFKLPVAGLLTNNLDVTGTCGPYLPFSGRCIHNAK